MRRARFVLFALTVVAAPFVYAGVCVGAALCRDLARREREAIAWIGHTAG